MRRSWESTRWVFLVRTGIPGTPPSYLRWVNNHHPFLHYIYILYRLGPLCRSQHIFLVKTCLHFLRQPVPRAPAGLPQQDGDRHHEVHIPLPPGPLRLLLRYEPVALVLRRPREAGLHGRPEGPQQQPDHHARRVGQEEQQDGLRERWQDHNRN